MDGVPQFFRRLGRTGLLATVGLIAAAVAGLWLVRGSAAPVDFNRDVRPILHDRCIACHGGIRQNGGFGLVFREDALDTTDSGAYAIVPGESGASELMRRVRHNDPDERMPPEGAPLTDAEIETLQQWIEQGAAWADHWAYVPPRPVPLPAVSNPGWVQNGIDRFILARLDAEALSPSPRADCATLIRRVSLDLTGIPPSPEEVEAFCRETSQEAYEAVVDRLLASPRYGEHWAALWLDLARYADSQGYEKDLHRTIWRYRDWVIQAFNRDLSFDRFTTEQLAGDLLPEPTEDQLIATAFHRNTMTNDEGGTDDEEFRVAAVIDRVNTTWEVWQGTTMACVQCHDHPYDPFRQADFYRFYAFLNNTEDADQTDEEPVLLSLPDTLTESERHEAEALIETLDRVRQEMDEAVSESDDARPYLDWLKRLEEHVALAIRPPKFEGQALPVGIVRIAGVPDSERDPQQKAMLERYYASIAPELAPLREKRGEVEKDLRAFNPIPTPVLRELAAGERRVTRVFDRGNFLTPSEVVEPGVPASMPAMPADAPNDRLGMARWLASEGNPLTARVMVNRFWAAIFGTGIVETLEDFGTQGELPSHPDLLDWLALEFMQEQAWSVKAMLRQIVTSATYQQTSRVSPELLERDPGNRLLARGMRVRLSAEQIRDQALAVSGLLSEKMFGSSVMPPQPPGLWNTPYNSADWVNSEGEDRYRRGVYTYWRRTVPYPSMLAFDAPSREVCVSRRIRTNTPLQALVTLNDPVFVEAAQALARLMVDEGGARLDDRLKRGYERALMREPGAQTLAVLRTLYDDALHRYKEPLVRDASLREDGGPGGSEKSKEPLVRGTSHRGAENPIDGAEGAELAALTVVANAIMNLDAFITRE